MLKSGVLAALLFLLAAAGASAQSLPKLESAITDQTGVLDSDRGAIQSALQTLFDKTGVQLYVLFVETTGGEDINTYTELVGAQLGPRDALLVVALTDRTDAISIGAGLRDEVSQVDIDQVRTSALEPGLASGDFGGAVTRSAQALAPVFGAEPTPAPTSPPGPPAPAVDFGPAVIVGIATLLIAIGVWLIIARVIALRRQRIAAFAEARTQEELGRQANRMLIATDDGLRDAEQEIGFAEAEFGAEEAAPLRKALAGAKSELSAAFQIGQLLDDTIPEPPEQRRQMIQEIIERCGRAQAVIDAQQKRLDELRDLERNAPQVIERLDSEISAAATVLNGAGELKDRLSGYATSNTDSVAGNFDAAEAKLEAARKALAEGRTTMAAGRPAGAATAAKAAEQAVADAKALFDAASHLADNLDATAAKLDAELAAASTDLEKARSVAVGLDPSLAQTFADAETALGEARAAADRRPPDVMTAYRRAVDANNLADKVLETARAAEEKRVRAQQAAASAITAAEANIARASDYIEAYRRSQNIGRMARNRVAEAQRELDTARSLVATDTAQALVHAQSASRLAAEAYGYAQQVAPTYGPIDYGSVRPGTDLGSLVIGAILGGMFSGGGRSTGGGGGGWTAPTPGSGGGGDDWTGGFSGGRTSGGHFGGFGSGGFGGGSGGGFSGGRTSSGRW